MELKESLKALGWNLSLEGLTKCVESCRQQGWEPTPRNVEKIAVDRDLRAVGEKILSEDILRNLQHQVEGPIVLQVQRVKNVVVPSSSQHLPSPSRRLLRLQLTDGHVHCSAVEMGGPIQNLSPLTPPGTKVRLRGKVEVRNGFLLLGKASLEHLGGQVEHLLKKWSVQQIVPDNFERRKAGTDGPPPFISFKDIASTGKHPQQRQEHSVGPHSREQSKHPQQRQEHSVGPHSKEQSKHPQQRQEHSVGPHSKEQSKHPQQRQRDPGRDKTAAAQTTTRRQDGKSAGYKPRQPSQQFRNEDGGERDGHLRTQQQYQHRTSRPSTSHRAEGDGRAAHPFKAAANDFDSPGHSTRDAYRQPKQRDDSRPSRSYQRGNQEESVRKTEYQLSDWLDQKLKLNSRSSSDSQRGSEYREEEYREEEYVRDSLNVEVRDRVRDATREGQYSEYGRREPEYGRREPQYGRREPQYGRREPEYGRREPQYGRREPQYGRREPQYGRREPEYGRREPEYGRREPQYGRREPQYGRKELQSGRREEQRWRDEDSQDGPDSGGKKSTFDQPREHYLRPPRFQQQRRDELSDWLYQKPKTDDTRRSSGQQYGTEYKEEIESEFKSEKPEVHDRYGTEKYGRREFQQSKSGGQGRKRDEQTRAHSKDRAEKVFEKHDDSGGMKAQRSSSERRRDQQRDDHYSKRHKDGDLLASHPGVREAWAASGGEGEIDRGSSQSRYGSDGGELGREKYNWDWVNKGVPCGATKQ